MGVKGSIDSLVNQSPHCSNYELKANIEVGCKILGIELNLAR